MSAHKVPIVLLLLCGILPGAFAVPSASAVETGTDAAICVAGGGAENYTDAHCNTTAPEGPLGGSFGIEQFEESSTSGVTSTNAETKNSTTESTPTVLLATIGGVNAEISCKKVHSEGTLENKAEGEVHKILGSGVVVKYSECEMPKPVGCKVHSPGEAAGTIATNSLKSESVEGTPMTQKFAPTTGTKLGELVLESCVIAGTYTVTGTISAEPSGQMSAEEINSTGATLVVNLPKNASSTLVVAGQKAGLTSATTVKMNGGDPIVSTGPPFGPQFRVKAAAYPATLTGAIGGTSEVFLFGSESELVCREATYTGTLGARSRILRLKPSYGECEGFGFPNAAVNPMGCEWELFGPKKLIGEPGYKTTASALDCPPGDSMRFEVEAAKTNCEIEVPEDSGLAYFKIENQPGPPRWLQVKPQLIYFSYQIVTSEPLCHLPEGKEHEDGIYLGKFLLTAGGNPLFVG